MDSRCRTLPNPVTRRLRTPSPSGQLTRGAESKMNDSFGGYNGTLPAGNCPIHELYTLSICRFMTLTFRGRAHKACILREPPRERHNLDILLHKPMHRSSPCNKYVWPGIPERTVILRIAGTNVPNEMAQRVTSVVGGWLVFVDSSI
jgi:hypothetical protein